MAFFNSRNCSWFSDTDSCLVKHSAIPAISFGNDHYSKLSRLACIPAGQHILCMEVIFMKRGTLSLCFILCASYMTLMTIYGVSNILIYNAVSQKCFHVPSLQIRTYSFHGLEFFREYEKDQKEKQNN